jgi:hypothetical protein
MDDRIGEASVRRARAVVGEVSLTARRRLLLDGDDGGGDGDDSPEVSAPPSVEAMRKLTVRGRFITPDEAAEAPLMAWNHIGS